MPQQQSDSKSRTVSGQPRRRRRLAGWRAKLVSTSAPKYASAYAQRIGAAESLFYNYLGWGAEDARDELQLALEEARRAEESFPAAREGPA